MESRHGNLRGPGAKLKSSELPVDYVKMVTEVFSNHFDEGLRALAARGLQPSFAVTGAVFPNEVLLTVALLFEGQLAGTAVHASVDFDPKASSPTAQDLLSACVDAIGGVLNELIDPNNADKLEALSGDSLNDFENAPLQWTSVEVERFRVHVKVDRTNPKLESMADDWLRQNDPKFSEQTEQEQSDTERRFFTGPKKPEDLAQLTEKEDDESDEDPSGAGGSRTLH